MPTPNQAVDENDADQWEFPCYEWQTLNTECRRTDSDRSSLGIPADYPFFQDPNIECDPTTDFPPASQTSYCQGSWQTVSATTHGTSRSLQEPNYGQYSLPIRVCLPAENSTPRITVNDFNTQPVVTTGSNYTRLDAGAPIDNSRAPDYGAYSQTQAVSSDPLSLTPHTSSPDPENVNVDPQWMEDMGFTTRIDLDDIQDRSLAYTGTEFAQTSSPMEVSGQTQHHYPDFGQLSPIMRQGGSPQAAIEPASAVALDCKQAPDGNSYHTQTEGSQKQAGPQRTKRKRQSSSKRENVDEINSVRDKGACIRCAVLHEKVSYKVPLGHSSGLTGLSKCDIGDPCATCKSNSQKAKIWKQPCVRLSLSDAEVHRTGKCAFCPCRHG